MTALESLRAHWPEYLIEGWALGTFMVSASVVATLLGSPGSPVVQAVPGMMTRTAMAAIAMGLTAIALIHSPWGKRSGAHMNPAVTLTFWRLGKTKRWDAIYFITSQTIGGTLGVLAAAALLGSSFTDQPVHYAATLPGSSGPLAAFIAELAISGLLMFVILTLSGSRHFAPFTGLAAGFLVAVYIFLESPVSGMSMNPARSFASAAPAMLWQYFWIYLTAPVIGMLAAAQIYLAFRGTRRLACAKLLHPTNIRCIHCGYEP